MAYDSVVFSNDFFLLDISNLTMPELDLLITLFAVLRVSETPDTTIPFIKLRRLSRFWSNSNRYLARSLESMRLKLSMMELHTEKIISQFTFFSKFELNMIDSTLTVSINPQFAFVLHPNSGNYTRFSRVEFISLKGKYVKLMFLLLRRFRATGVVYISMEDFRAMMAIPKGYSARDVTEKILKPTVRKLRNSFPGLSFEAKKGLKWGSPIISYTFTFQKEVLPRQKKVIEPPKATPENPVRATDAHLATTEASVATSQIHKKATSFFDYPQRRYDYDELERKLFAAQERERESDEE